MRPGSGFWAPAGAASLAQRVVHWQAGGGGGGGAAIRLPGGVTIPGERGSAGAAGHLGTGAVCP